MNQAFTDALTKYRQLSHEAACDRIQEEGVCDAITCEECPLGSIDAILQLMERQKAPPVH